MLGTPNQEFEAEFLVSTLTKQTFLYSINFCSEVWKEYSENTSTVH